MTYLPAPYESPQQDDLSATIAAILAGTVGLITAWVLGAHAYRVVRQAMDGLQGNLTAAQEDAFEASRDTVVHRHRDHRVRRDPLAGHLIRARAATTVTP